MQEWQQTLLLNVSSGEFKELKNVHLRPKRVSGRNYKEEKERRTLHSPELEKEFEVLKNVIQLPLPCIFQWP